MSNDSPKTTAPRPSRSSRTETEAQIGRALAALKAAAKRGLLDRYMGSENDK
ncbi:hypothetical protein MWH03_00505 [Klebsiella pneumoniae]|nr:hypothetical protein [Klebsiella pneumoniae]